MSTATATRRPAVRGTAGGRVWVSYARLSRANERAKDGKGASIQIGQQHDNNTAYIERADPGYGEIIYLTDDGFSAYLDVYRPDFEHALRMIERREVGAFVGWHADRITRQVEVTARLWRVCETARVELHTTLGGMHTDPDSIYFETMIAERESRQKSRRMLESHKGKAERGEWSGGPRAFGYADDMSATIPAEAAVIESLAARALNGESMASLARSLNAAGIESVRGGEWSGSVVKKMLVSPRLTGIRMHDGKEFPAAWPAIIERPMHDALVFKLTAPDRRKATSTANKHLLSGIATCGPCGAPVRGAWISRKGRHMYRCVACNGVGRGMEDVDMLVSEWVIRRLEEIDLSGTLVSDDNNRQAAALEAERQTLTAKRASHAALNAVGDMDDATFAASGKAITAREAEIGAALALLTEDAAAPQRALEGATGPGARAAWEGWTADASGAGLARRRAIVRLLVDVTILPTVRGARTFREESVSVVYRDLS